MNKLVDYIEKYQNTGKCNDETHIEFSLKTDQVSLLKTHRDYIEQNKLGFGDRAFHFMWYLLLNDLKNKREKVSALEIGVYKGQVISLWSLLSKELGIPMNISAISPLEGTVTASTLLNNRVINKIRRMFSASFRKQEKEGNLYLKVDYKKIISDVFNHFGMSLETVQVHKGYSNNPDILTKIRDERFDLIYIDGDHSYEGALNDIKNYSRLINTGGYLVMDDASWFLEGSVFWKGHEEVSKASEIIESLGFENVLNVGHNRVYKKQ